ncbi:MAG: 50S ribosome-binding GTPase, partial [Propionibacteriaceae bacterium]|nr:50S ribosome-binding GTPase [Propionibacteriaceae bacterium]
MDLTEWYAGLMTAVDACQERVDTEVLHGAQVVIDRVDRRLSLTRDATVIAIAGATGAGKSSVFNALTRTTLAEPGVNRPMTERSLALTFGDADTSALLDWLGVANRHVTAGGELTGVVLIDLVDNDSVAVSHRAEVDHLLEVVDEFLWVVDPQKYADALLHERYLRPLAGHSNVMTFVLNQIDRLSEAELAVVRADFIRLLHDDGITDPVVYEVSGLSGKGIDALRGRVIEAASTKNSMVTRLGADILVQAKALRGQLGLTPAGTLAPDNLRHLTTACLEVAGTDQIAAAVRTSVQRRGASATGWPWLAWLTRLRVDPLKRLHLDKAGTAAGDDARLEQTGLAVHPVARARVETAVRGVGNEAGAKVPLLWRGAIDRLVQNQAATLPMAIEHTVATTDLGANNPKHRWGTVRLTQWLIFAITIVGLLWLLANLLLTSFFGLGALPTPRLGGWPAPTILVLGGLALGLVIAAAARVAVHVRAKAAARTAVVRLRKAMTAIAAEHVIDPLNRELARHD